MFISFIDMTEFLSTVGEGSMTPVCTYMTNRVQPVKEKEYHHLHAVKMYSFMQLGDNMVATMFGVIIKVGQTEGPEKTPEIEVGLAREKQRWNKIFKALGDAGYNIVGGVVADDDPPCVGKYSGEYDVKPEEPVESDPDYVDPATIAKQDSVGPDADAPLGEPEGEEGPSGDKEEPPAETSADVAVSDAAKAASPKPKPNGKGKRRKPRKR